MDSNPTEDPIMGPPLKTEEFWQYILSHRVIEALEPGLSLLYQLPVKPGNLHEFFAEFLENGGKTMAKISYLRAELCYKKEQLKDLLQETANMNEEFLGEGEYLGEDPFEPLPQQPLKKTQGHLVGLESVSMDQVKDGKSALLERFIQDGAKSAKSSVSNHGATKESTTSLNPAPPERVRTPSQVLDKIKELAEDDSDSDLSDDEVDWEAIMNFIAEHKEMDPMGILFDYRVPQGIEEELINEEAFSDKYGDPDLFKDEELNEGYYEGLENGEEEEEEDDDDDEPEITKHRFQDSFSFDSNSNLMGDSYFDHNIIDSGSDNSSEDGPPRDGDDVDSTRKKMYKGLRMLKEKKKAEANILTIIRTDRGLDPIPPKLIEKKGHAISPCASTASTVSIGPSDDDTLHLSDKGSSMLDLYAEHKVKLVEPLSKAHQRFLRVREAKVPVMARGAKQWSPHPKAPGGWSTTRRSSDPDGGTRPLLDGLPPLLDKRGIPRELKVCHHHGHKDRRKSELARKFVQENFAKEYQKELNQFKFEMFDDDY